jgi:NADPH2:quinone reductase
LFIKEMQAAIVHQWLTSPSELQVDHLPLPSLGEGQVLVKVHAAAANFFDILMVQGKYQFKPPLPFTPGAEFAGEIVSCHPSITSLSVGQRVFGGVQYGAFADYVVASIDALYEIPRHMSYKQAAGLFVTYPTSYAALVLRARLQPGETCLIHAGAGGVGIPAIQIAKHLGATVIATVGSEEKERVAKEAGADIVINYTKQDFASLVLKHTNKKGVDVVFDPVGLIDASLKCIAWSGRLVVVGFAAGTIEKIATNRILLKNASVQGLFWGAYALHEPHIVKQVWRELLVLFQSKHLQPVLYKHVFVGWEKVPQALERLGSRNTFGKVILVPHSSRL